MRSFPDYVSVDYDAGHGGSPDDYPNGFWSFLIPDCVDGYPAGHVPWSVDDLAGFAGEELPVSPKYYEGYRSLGTIEGSGTAAEQPAWLRLDEGSEREERTQDKEGLIARLRDLGYM